MAGCHVKAGHHQRCTSSIASLQQPCRKTLESCAPGYKIPVRNQESESYVRMGSGLDISVFADANYAEKADDRRSVFEVAVTVGKSSVSWFSSTQKIVTLSTTETEYIALGDGVKEALFVKGVLSFIIPSMDEFLILSTCVIPVLNFISR